MRTLAALSLSLLAAASSADAGPSTGTGRLPFRGIRRSNGGRWPSGPRAGHTHWLSGFKNTATKVENEADKLEHEASAEGGATSTASNSSDTAQTLQFSQLVDHFPSVDSYSPHPANGTSWKQNYWYDATNYKKGGPVIFFDPGEGPGDPSYVSDQYMPGALAKALGGIIIELEHRYFGTSFPVPDLSTDNLRFLTVRQAMADSAYFATHVEIDELKSQGIDITAPNTPWISYGGSYPGAKSAFTRVTYPTIFYGAIASSAVTHPVEDMWTYYDVARRYLEPTCSALLVSHASTLDRIWSQNQTSLDQQSFALFGMGYQSLDKVGFADAVAQVYGAWQTDAQNGITDASWNPQYGEFGPTFDTICANITNPSIAKGKASSYVNQTLLQPLTTILKSPDPTVTQAFQAANLTYDSSATADMVDDVLASFLSFTELLGGGLQQECGNTDYQSCFSTAPPPQKTLLSISGDQAQDRDWEWLVCNEFGFQETAPSTSTPSIVSRQLSAAAEYQYYCQNQFPAGQYYKLTDPTDTSGISVFGDYAINSSRLIEVGGQDDPWRPVTPMMDGNPVPNTTDSPAMLIPYAGHCFDFQQPSAGGTWDAALQPVYNMYVSTIKSWLSDFSTSGNSSSSSTGSTAAGATSSGSSSASWTPTTQAESDLLSGPTASEDLAASSDKALAPSSGSSSSGSSSGPSTWVWVGVGVGAAAVLGAAAFGFYRYRRGRTGPGRGGPGSGWSFPKLPGQKRSYFPIGSQQAPQLETTQVTGQGGFYREYGTVA